MTIVQCSIEYVHGISENHNSLGCEQPSRPRCKTITHCTCIHVECNYSVCAHASHSVCCLTVSAAVRLMPRPPALVLSRNTNISDLQKWDTHGMNMHMHIYKMYVALCRSTCTCTCTHVHVYMCTCNVRVYTK